MIDESTLHAEIAMIEDRLALRRRRVATDLEAARARVEETRMRVRRAAGWLPVVGIVALVAAGLVLGRRRAMPAMTVAGAGVARAGALGTLMALGGAALRIARSPPGQAIWRAIRARQRPAARMGR